MESKETDKKKVELISQAYYSRKEIQNAIYEFCKHRETIANFNNKFFAKRPDCLDYPSDIFNSVKKGATSFHCSEELWENPLDIKTEMTPKQYNEIKTGWDFLIDIDSPFLDYGKIAARLLIKELENHGIKNIGIKFSGSKGFHILVPWQAFPERVGEELTKNKFPEWPRIIADYLFNKIRGPMNEEILKQTGREKLKEKGELISEHLCPKCNTPTIKKKVGKYVCEDKIKCKGELESMKSNRKEMICPNCFGKMKRVSEREIDFCEKCKINTAKIEASKSNYGGEIRKEDIQFKVEDTIKSTEDAVDLVLVSPRHLFRAPYSLHEKTALSSVPIKPSEIEEFKPSDADPLKIKETKSFMPSSLPNEASELLMQALDWGRENAPKENKKKFTGESIDLKGLTITENMFPKSIKKLLKGIKQDGRKRALSLLLSFFSSLGFPKEYMEDKITEWNKKNYHPLKTGYIKSQINWISKNPRMPQNYDKPIYKELGILIDTQGFKNPINYTIKQAFINKKRSKNAKKDA